jgi:nucleoside-diphosphate-sugar epimerase
VEAVTGLLRIEPPFSRRSMAFFQNDNAFEIGAARDALGFAPSVDLEEGLRRTFDASRPVGVT